MKIGEPIFGTDLPCDNANHRAGYQLKIYLLYLEWSLCLMLTGCSLVQLTDLEHSTQLSTLLTTYSYRAIKLRNITEDIFMFNQLCLIEYGPTPMSLFLLSYLNFPTLTLLLSYLNFATLTILLQFSYSFPPISRLLLSYSHFHSLTNLFKIW